jgi:hypothetical protein
LKRKRLWVYGLVLLAVGAGLLVLRLQDSGDFAVRVIGRTNDAAGQVQIIYEITNRTSRDVVFGLASVEARTDTGWQAASNSNTHTEIRINRSLEAMSVSAIRIFAPPGGKAVRGELQYEKDDGLLKRNLRTFARRVGLPRQVFDPRSSVLHDPRIPFGSIKLPEVETSGNPFLLASDAAGAWPTPEPSHHNYTFTKLELATVLKLYREMSGAELQVHQRVDSLRAKITVDPQRDVTMPEAVRLIEKALREQAGVVVTHQDSNHVTVTYDETLKVNRAR